MESLPTEIVESILVNKNLSLEDIINVSYTSKRLYSIIHNSNAIWKNIYLKRWPQYKKLINEKFDHFKVETRNVFHVRAKVRSNLELMTSQCYTHPNLSKHDFAMWDFILPDDIKTYEYVSDYLQSLSQEQTTIKSIEIVPLFTPGNKTLIYYCTKVLQYLRHVKVTHQYYEYMSLPENQRILEKGAVLISQWCQPHKIIKYKDVCESLDKLTDEVREELRVVAPNHPLFHVNKDLLLKWKTKNHEHNQFNGYQSQQIIDTISNVLFKKHSFCGNVTDFHLPQNSYIDKVLEKKCGLPITLSIVYESIARRMGVNCEPMNIPAHFLLRFQKDPESKTVFFIDAFNKGQLFPKGICPHSHSSPDLIPRASAYKVLRRMVANLEESHRMHITDLSHLHSTLELLVLISPNDLNCIVNLARFCMSLNMNTKYIEEIIVKNRYDEQQNADNVLQMLRDYEIHRQNENSSEQHQSKTRTDNIKFAVGMIIEHKVLHYRGVITDWTPTCKARYNWQKTMNVDKLEFKGNQPFYNVIVEDGTHHYVAQENIEIIDDASGLEANDEIGRHFSHYFVTHFVPNLEKESEYPEDKAIRQQFYKNVIWKKTKSKFPI